MLVGMTMMPPSLVSSGTQVYSEAGAYSFTVPFGVSSITIDTLGGAGGGASGWISEIYDEKTGTEYTLQYGGDGGSAATATAQVSVAPLSTISIVVGAGGSGGVAPGSGIYNTATPGGDGGDTTAVYAGSEVVKADAGVGGTKDADGAGGLASASIGDTKANGVTGAGGAGGYSNTGDGIDGNTGSVTITW